LAKKDVPSSAAKDLAAILSSPEFAAAQSKARISYGKTVELVNRDPMTWLKLPAQARSVLITLAKAGGKDCKLSVNELTSKMKSVGGLVTKQTELRIFLFYRKDLVGKGFIKVV